MTELKRLPPCFLAIALASCSTTAALYPISGPLSKQSPPPVLRAKVNGITGNTGSLTLTLPDGEQCEGTWSSIAPRSVTELNGSLFNQYGSSLGFSARASGNLPGVNRGE